MTDDTPDDLPDNAQLKKDRSYAPSSGRETERLQEDQSTPADIDGDQVKTLPGTGGPDDSGDIEVDPADIHIPGRAQEQ
jgi:hypothetical protein